MRIQPYFEKSCKNAEFKLRITFLEKACRLQSDELSLLKRDVRGTHTKELEIERDVLWEEARCLQKVARKLASMQTETRSEYKEIVKLRERNEQIEEENQKLSAGVVEIFELLKKVTQALSHSRYKTKEASISNKRHLKQISYIRRHSLSTESMIHELKHQKHRFQVRISVLKKKLATSKKELTMALQERDKARAAMMKKMIEKQRKETTPRSKTPRRSPKTPDEKDKFGKKD